jgi:hypothetical protein
VAPKILMPAVRGPHGHLLEAGDHGLGLDLLLRLRPAVAQVVGAEHHDDMGDARLGQDVAVEAAQPAVAAHVVQDPVAAQPLVHDAHRPAAGPALKTARELIRPPAERVERRDVGVGQRVAQRHDPPGLRRGQHVHPADEVPVVGELADRHGHRPREVARRRDVAGLARVAAGDPGGGRQIAGQVDADGQVAERRQGERDGVADQQRAGGDRRARRAAEGQRTVGARHDGRAALAQPHPRRADDERTLSVRVRQPDPERVAAEARPDVHPQRVVAEGHAVGRGGRRRPGADPVDPRLDHVVSRHRAPPAGGLRR